jgi:hypothetical protein
MKNASLLSDDEVLEWFEKLTPNLKIKFWRSMASSLNYQDFVENKYKIIDYYRAMMSYENSHQLLRKKLGA